MLSGCFQFTSRCAWGTPLPGLQCTPHLKPLVDGIQYLARFHAIGDGVNIRPTGQSIGQGAIGAQPQRDDHCLGREAEFRRSLLPGPGLSDNGGLPLVVCLEANYLHPSAHFHAEELQPAQEECPR